MKLRISLLAAALGLLAFSTDARALTITQSQGFAGQPNLAKVVEFDRFNPAYGTLQSVEWRLMLDIDGGSLTVDNDGPLPASVSVELGAAGSLLSSEVTLLNSFFQPILSGANSVGVSTGSVFELAGDNGDGMTFDPTMPDADTHVGGSASTSASDFLSPQFLADYVGTEMFKLTVDVDQLLEFGGTGGVSGQFEPVTAMPNVVLIYEFVPEPTTATLALLGLLPLLNRARREGR